MVQNLICFSSQYLICGKCQYTLLKKAITARPAQSPTKMMAPPCLYCGLFIVIELLTEKQLFHKEVLFIRKILVSIYIFMKIWDHLKIICKVLDVLFYSTVNQYNKNGEKVQTFNCIIHTFCIFLTLSRRD